MSKPASDVARRSINRIPGSTYRLQLGPDLTLDQVTALLPYLDKLGITDVYLSPLFRARAESSHGYDVVDHGVIDPAIGDLQSFSRLATAAHDLGMGILLDVVPNHMGINDPANIWWLDVLENGEGSCFADYFDIEWRPPAAALENRILLPFLGDHFGRVLESGQLRVLFRERRLQLEYGLRRFPLAPPTWPMILESVLVDEHFKSSDSPVPRRDREELLSICTQLRNLPPAGSRDATAMEQRYREQKIAARRLDQLLAASPEVRDALDHALDRLNGQPGDPHSFDRLEHLLGAQWYRLANWRVASDEINYRRFFDVNDLAAIRVEDPRVFKAVHQLVARLLEAGWITGLRIDHPDGLREPHAYFKNLQMLYRSTQPFDENGASEIYVLAEKILSGDEQLPSNWQVCGTTGYDLLNIISRVLVHGDGLMNLRTIYDSIGGEARKPADIVYESRRTVLLSTMASELQMLTAQLYRLAQQQRSSLDFTQPVLQRALREVLACMNVYRSYARPDSWDVDETDYRNITQAVRMAKRRNRTMPHAVFDFIASILLLEHPPTLSSEQADARRQFALKFQQVSGPIAAKGVEDTAFYRYYPLVALNEVGAELDARPVAPDEFHRLMQHRRQSWPHSMSATSTHDSKRGEDLRARLLVLSEMPKDWQQAVVRWRKINRALLGEFEGEAVPDANEEYFIYQTLVGTWPLGPLTESELESYRNRVLQYFEKAFREAKVHTSWMNPSEPFEAAVRSFVTALLSSNSHNFTDDLAAFVRGIAGAGFVNSLAQLLLKMTLPGMPDFYRGTELWDFHLVDPDNRRLVDYDARRHRLKNLHAAADKDLPSFAAELASRWPDADVKMWIMSAGLRLLREWPEVFSFGDYIPLTPTGSAADHTLAFARRSASQHVVCVVPLHFHRLSSRMQRQAEGTGPPRAEWADTQLLLPAEFPDEWVNRFTGQQHTATELVNSDSEVTGCTALEVAELFSTLPVALLVSPTT